MINQLYAVFKNDKDRKNEREFLILLLFGCLFFILVVSCNKKHQKKISDVF